MILPPPSVQSTSPHTRARSRSTACASESRRIVLRARPISIVAPSSVFVSIDFFGSLGVNAGMKPSPAAPPSPATSASVAGDRSQADGNDTDTAAALITDDTAKSDDPTAPAAQSARDDASCTHALNDAVVVVAGKGRQDHEGIVRFVGATRFAPPRVGSVCCAVMVTPEC